MPVRRSITAPDGVYFITFTCARWLPLFKVVDGNDIIYNWFNYLKQNGHYVIGYVIMPDHLLQLLLLAIAENRNEWFIVQNLTYMHWNPCKCAPQLAALPENYVHSSAKFYLTGEQGIYKVMNYTELEDVDLTAAP